MSAVIGEILPPALGVAISPIPIIAAILMLLSPKALAARRVGFLPGWVVGITVAVVVFTLLRAASPEDGPRRFQADRRGCQDRARRLASAVGRPAVAFKTAWLMS